MKVIILTTIILLSLFASTDDKKLYKNLKNYHDNLTTKKIDANINKVVIRKTKSTKVEKIVKNTKFNTTKYTKSIKKEAPASK